MKRSSSSSRGQALPIAAILLGLVAVAVLATSGLFGGSDPGKPAPSDKPTPPPTVYPTPTPSIPTPTEKPSDDRLEVDLDNVNGRDVVALIEDRSGHLVRARTGNAGDGMSVRWGQAKIENLGSDTIRLTWVGLPQDGEVQIRVQKVDDEYLFVIVQNAPYPNTDAMGQDLILILDFDEDVKAENFTAEFREGFDTDD